MEMKMKMGNFNRLRRRLIALSEGRDAQMFEITDDSLPVLSLKNMGIIHELLEAMFQGIKDIFRGEKDNYIESALLTTSNLLKAMDALLPIAKVECALAQTEIVLHRSALAYMRKFFDTIPDWDTVALADYIVNKCFVSLPHVQR